MRNFIKEYNQCFNTECKTISGILSDVFNMGMTYGLLKLTDEKYQSPSIPTRKRQPHSKEWFNKSHKEANRYWKGILDFKEPEQYDLF